MDKKYYLRVSADDYNTKLENFCKENDIEVEVRSELFAFPAESAVDIIMKEQNLEKKKLFTEDENGEYEYDTLCYEIEDTMKSILDDSWNRMTDAFYNRLEVRNLFRREGNK